MRRKGVMLVLFGVFFALVPVVFAVVL